MSVLNQTEEKQSKYRKIVEFWSEIRRRLATPYRLEGHIFSRAGASNPSLYLGRSYTFSIIWPQSVKNWGQNDQNAINSINSEFNLGHTKYFLGRELDAPVLERHVENQNMDYLQRFSRFFAKIAIFQRW